jgi:hypothetical protein
VTTAPAARGPAASVSRPTLMIAGVRLIPLSRK